MGGKFWSKEEEIMFWFHLIPHSAKRIGDDVDLNKEQSWDWIGEQMQERMGDGARRDYTHLCVFEHYFQNTFLGRRSPNVGNLADKYRAHEEALKKYKEELAARKANEDAGEDAGEDAEEEESGSDSVSDSVKEEKSEDEVTKSESETSVKGKSATGDADDKGTKDAPIQLDCQYTAIPPYHYHDHTPVPRFTVPSAPPSFAPHGSLPRPQHYFHQFLANHDRLENAESEDDSLFVTQSSASWMDAVVPRVYGYHHRTAPSHEASSSAQFFW